jgi:hypothetical protein
MERLRDGGGSQADEAALNGGEKCLKINSTKA